MRDRRHHNNKGTRQIKNGQTSKDLKRIAEKLKVPFKENNNVTKEDQ